MKFFTNMIGHTGLKKSSIKVLKTDEDLIISCRACLFFVFLFFDGKKRIYHLNFYLLSTLDYWILLICLAMELRKRYTLRLFLMCLEERSFRSCSPSGNGGQMTHLGERCGWGVLGLEKTMLWNELHQRQFLKSPLTFHVHFPLAVSWALFIELH